MLGFLFQAPNPAGFRNFQPSELAAPLVEGRIGYRILAAKLGHGYASFGLFENPDNLLLTKMALPQDRPPGRVTNF